MESEEAFPRLKTSDREIRLLSFWWPEHFLRFDVTDGQHRVPRPTIESRVYRLDCHPPYTALSYTWGRMDLVRSIRINGDDVRAGSNLYDACQSLWLLDLGSRKEAMFSPWSHVWIDALCINQQDTEERNHQVGLMGQIYAFAD